MKKWIAVLIGFFMFFAMAAPMQLSYAKEKENNASALADQTKSAILIEQSTGKVLYSKNDNKKLPPASMTKMMTLLLIFKALDTGDLHLTDKVPVSEHAASMGGSQVFLEPGEIMSVDDMLKAIVIGSGNDASMAMAEYISGSEQGFVKQMNKEAALLHLTHTHFMNPTGLPEKNHYSSAHDMAVIAKNLLNHKNILNYSSKYEAYLRQNTDHKFWLVNTNKMIRTYQGVDGLKTGFTQEAKYCLTATAKKNGMRVIAVVMGSPSSKVRNEQVASLLNYAYANYSVKTLVKPHTPIGTITLLKSGLKKVQVETNAPAAVVLKKGEKMGRYSSALQLDKDKRAPLKKGSKVGNYVIKKDNKVITKIPVVLSKTAPSATWWDYIRHTTDRLLSMT